MRKLGKKLIATILAMVIASGYLSTVCYYGSIVLASNGDKATNQANVEFDSYFKNEEGNISKDTTKQTNQAENRSIYFDVGVYESGYLKEAQIEIQALEKGKEPNFMIGEGKNQNDLLQSIDPNANKINLNNIPAGKGGILELPIQMREKQTYHSTDFSQENKIIFTGIYVDKNGNENKVSKTVTLQLNWSAKESQAILEQTVTKYIPYHIQEQKGIILQTVVKIQVKDNVLPVRNETIEIKVPTIQGQKPTEVKVEANSTKAINGKQIGEGFGENNYEYNAEKQTIIIHMQNDDNTISWQKQVADEYSITYVYSEETMQAIGEEGTKIALEAKAKIELYANPTMVLEGNVQGEQEIKDKLQDVVTLKTSMPETISKGYLYANTKQTIAEQDKKETTYTQTYEAEVAYAKLIDRIYFTLKAENAVDAEGNVTSTKTQNGNSTYYQTIKINKAQYQNLLGEEGTISIKTLEGTVLQEINKDTQTDEEGNMVIDLAALNLAEVKIETTKPQKEGKLAITAQKAIKTTGYTKGQWQQFTKWQAVANIQGIKEEQIIIDRDEIAEATLTEPNMQINLQTNRDTLSTETENKNILLTAVLETAKLENTLFHSPTIEIELPEYVENITFNKEPEIRFNDQLSIKNYSIMDRNGKKVIIIHLQGEQTRYDIGLVSGGANIVLDTNIKLKTLTPTSNTQITMKVTNAAENARVAPEQATTTIPMKMQSPAGTVTIQTISNYNEAKETVQSIGGESKTGTLDLYSTKEQTATIQTATMNNNGVAMKQISILGRTIFTGNKKVGTEETLGTTFDAIMTSPITISGIDSSKVTIYYSENGEATQDLTRIENGWTTSPADISKVKSYLIVGNEGFTMAVGEVIETSYTAKLPTELARNQYGYTNYGIYYTLENASSSDKTIASIIGISTGEGPEIEVTLSSNVENNAPVQEGQIIKYTVTVKNTGKVTAKGVIAAMDIPEGTNFVEYVQGEQGEPDRYQDDENKTIVTKAFDSIEPGKSEKFEVEVRVKEKQLTEEEEDQLEDDEEIPDVERTLVASSYATADELPALVTSNQLSNPIIKGFLSVGMVTSPGIITTLQREDELQYITTIENINDKQKKNVVAKMVIPEGLTYVEAYYEKGFEKITKGITYDEKTRTVTYQIGDMAEYEINMVYVTVKVDSKDENLTSVTGRMDITCNDGQNGTITIPTNEVTNKVKIKKPQLKATLMCDVPEGEIEEGEIIQYILEIKNAGNILLEDISIKSLLPEGLKYLSSKYEIEGMESTVGGGATTEGGEPIELTANIPADKTLIYTITAMVKELADGVQSKDISYSFTISQEEIGEFTTNVINHKVVPKDENNGNNGGGDDGNHSGGDLQGTGKIKGVVWEDSNKDGKRDNDERRIAGVEVMLYNYQTGKLVYDGSGKAVIVTTDSQGQYEFYKLPQGAYSVIFKYDSTQYSSTVYRANEVSDIMNSDAVDAKVTIDGVQFVAGLTEKLVLGNSNLYNIDLGLTQNEKFDLSLSKVVQNITVQNPTGTATYPYGTDLAKRELIARYVDQTTIVVEYKIMVKNEGAVPGYVKKIVDYLPEKFVFRAELNRDWYLGNDGAAYNSSLSNIKIEPGETKEVTLYLTKSLTENDIDTIHNTAEIYEAYNDLGLLDIDSTPGNKDSKEDDFGSADVILSIRTGAETFLFIGLTITIIAIIGVGTYFIRRKVLRKL